MKILIGTPIHICKDYSMEKWLENVSKLTYQADLLMVDNSPDESYVEKVKGYCVKYGIRNYKIEHVEINQALISDMRIEVSQEMIRRYVLSHDYDAWFSWECDQIIPINALNEMIRLMKVGDFMIVVHNCWNRLNPTVHSTDMGCTLVKRECLEKYEFLPVRDGDISFDVADRYADKMFKERVSRSGGNYIDVYGIINPIYHLNENT